MQALINKEDIKIEDMIYFLYQYLFSRFCVILFLGDFMSLKIDRLNSTFEKEISKILATEVKDNNIKFVTITGCDISSDLGFAKIYFTVLDESKKLDTIKSLEHAKSFIRGEISKRIEIRHTPELKFIYDDSINYGNKIDSIIEKINKKEKKD